jgi:hypothetical protein
MVDQLEVDGRFLKRVRSFLGLPEVGNHPLAWVWLVVAVVICLLFYRFVSTAKEFADLISAFAALLWPVAVLTIVGWFKPEIKAILERIKKGNFLGLEIELNDLKAKIDEAEATGPVNVVVTGTSSKAADGSGSVENGSIEAAGCHQLDAADAEIEEVLREAARSPRMGLMLLSAKMDSTARELASEYGSGTSRMNLSLSMLIRRLVETGHLTREDASALGLFNQVRNRIVHGHDADDDEIARAIDSGTRLLRILLTRLR